MTVSELIEELKKHDGNLQVGGRGHYGELLEIYSVGVNREGSVSIEIESAGDIPD